VREYRGAEGADRGGVWGGGVPLPTGEGSGEEAVWIERQFRRPRNDMSVLTVRSSVAVDGQNGHI